MSKTNTRGFTEAHLKTDDLAQIHATLSGDAFCVSLYEGGKEYWFFDEDDCREAAEFFTKLADELSSLADGH